MQESERRPAQNLPEADQVIAWLRDRDSVEHALQTSLGSLPSERDITLAQMGGALQATAQGLGLQAAAVWAGVPENILQGWIAKDPSFASALYAARALSAAHGIRPGKEETPAMIRALLVAVSDGATKPEAVQLAGFSDQGFRALLRASSTLDALLGAARRVRPARTRNAYSSDSHRTRRRPGRKPPAQWGFRLVQRDASGDQSG